MIARRALASLAGPLPLEPEQGSCVTIGNFDGVHLGHQALLALARERGRQLGLPVIAVTFAPHPAEVLASRPLPRLLLPEDRLTLLEVAGADLALLLEFTPEMAAMAPELFVRRVLLERLRMRELILGHDFALGRERAGTPERLARLGAACGFAVRRLDALRVDGAAVSSTRIRALIEQGAVRHAARLLGRLHTARGTVAHGKRRGTGLGFPTANLSPAATLLPGPGVYASFAVLPAAPGADLLAPGLPGFPAVTNIGCNPTFGPAGLSVETHIFDLSRDLYGLPLEVAFVERLRGEVTFSGPEALVAQLRRDAEEARALLCLYPPGGRQ